MLSHTRRSCFGNKLLSVSSDRLLAALLAVALLRAALLAALLGMALLAASLSSTRRSKHGSYIKL